MSCAYELNVLNYFRNIKKSFKHFFNIFVKAESCRSVLNAVGKHEQGIKLPNLSASVMKYYIMTKKASI